MRRRARVRVFFLKQNANFCALFTKVCVLLTTRPFKRLKFLKKNKILTFLRWVGGWLRKILRLFNKIFYCPAIFYLLFYFYLFLKSIENQCITKIMLYNKYYVNQFPLPNSLIFNTFQFFLLFQFLYPHSGALKICYLFNFLLLYVIYFLFIFQLDFP